jgi:hypothetical protein
MALGSYWRGRRLDFDPDRHVIEQERQRWVMDKLAGENAVIQELTVDPDRAYAEQRDAFIETGDETYLRRMLGYVR